jgi:adenylate kinase
MKPVIYLTGAPATGKSTLSRNLAKQYPELLVFAYSEQLREHLAGKSGGPSVSESEIRQKSSLLVTPQDIDDLDQKLVDLVRETRVSRPVLIDSHPVTKEAYGFRVTGFSTDRLLQLKPDVIVCLYASNEVIISRISAHSQGRPVVSELEASFHTQLQASVATQYGVILGKPVYLVDSAISETDLVHLVASKAKLAQR